MRDKINRLIGRRTVLRGTAIGTAVALGVPSVTAQNDIDIELEGRTSGWIGRVPEEVDGETNPTLELVEGESYTLVWENGDGAGHNFVIEDDEGDETFVESDIISGSGETQEVEFTAEEGMAEYYCAPHPQTMRGEIELVDAEPETAEEIEEFAAELEELYELRLDDEGWHGEYPEEIEGETDPTLSVQPGEAYTISFRNDIGEGDDEETLEDDDTENLTDNDIPDDGNNLTLFDDDGDEIVSTESIDPGERGGIVFVGTEEIEGYRDETSGSEGDVTIESV